MTRPLGVVGGTGFESIDGFTESRRVTAVTPFGAPSAPLIHGDLLGQPVVMLQRHGARRNIPPHKVNYRANVWALREAGVGDELYEELAVIFLRCPEVHVIDCDDGLGHPCPDPCPTCDRMASARSVYSHATRPMASISFHPGVLWESR